MLLSISQGATVVSHLKRKSDSNSADMNLSDSFSLVNAKAAPHPSLKRPAAFADDDEFIDAVPTASLDKSAAANKKFLAQNVQPARTMQRRLEAEMKVDQTVYEYDEVWDRMQESKQRQKEAKELASKDGKVCQSNLPMSSLLTACSPNTSKIFYRQPKRAGGTISEPRRR